MSNHCSLSTGANQKEVGQCELGAKTLPLMTLITLIQAKVGLWQKADFLLMAQAISHIEERLPYNARAS
jgi:hypothetical protein